MATEIRYPNIDVQLTGEDSNIFQMMGLVRVAMRRAGVSRDEIEAMSKEVTSSNSYNEAVNVLMRWVNVS